MASGFIRIRGAREHNLKGVDLDIPRDRLVVVTGLSGSGKSSLVFDTLYAEGQRRYVESVSPYARQFLELMQKPDVESIEGIPPTIAIEQRAGHPTPRSTVATSTEIYDFLRLLYARVGIPECWKCGRAITQQTAVQITDQLRGLPEGGKLMVLAPVVRGQKGEHRELLQRIAAEGYVRVRHNQVIKEIARVGVLNKAKRHDLEVVIDRLVVGRDDAFRRRLADSVEAGLRLGEGLLLTLYEAQGGKWEESLHSEKYACPYCGVSFGELQPRLFSFNSPYGACTACDGLGTKLELAEDLIVPDPALALKDGAIEAWRRLGRRLAIRYARRLRQFCDDFHVSASTPFQKIPEEKRKILMHGSASAKASADKGESPDVPFFEGVVPSLEHRFRETGSEYVKQKILSYMSELPCPACKGRRLKPESLAVKVGGRNIHEATTLPIEAAHAFFGGLTLSAEARQIGKPILKEIQERLGFLISVGLAYLTLDRRSATLSGGEAQRIRLASQVGSGLVGVCYVLDEPTIGLHERDNRRLIHTMKKLRDLGNTVVVVEHDEEIMRSADLLIDIGPEAGRHGGEVVACGTIPEVCAVPRSLTGRYLGGDLRIDVPAKRRRPDPEARLEVRGAAENNLKKVDVRFPLGVLTCVTGVSGSGKSTLVHDILYRALMRKLVRSKERPGKFDKLLGADRVDKVIIIDQSPIGRTPRSNPATYAGAFDEIRDLYAKTKEARLRGYQPGRFSFNVKGGRCEACEGQGTKLIEMHFLPDVYVRCEECRGRRYGRETLEVLYKGKSIADVLDLSVEESLGFFASFPKLLKIVRTMDEVGLGYIHLGQASTTLSGGEAQRMKLAAELAKPAMNHTLYILDEPTTGLHFADIAKLMEVLHRLTDLGNTVLLIEHNLHVLKTADWLIDLGPEGGDAGGEIVAEGTPEDVVKVERSYTGQYLKPYLERGARLPVIAAAR